MTTDIHGNTLKFVALQKGSGSVYGVVRMTVANYRIALLGDSADAGLFIIKTADETKSDFAKRAERDLGCPLDNDIWGGTK